MAGNVTELNDAGFHAFVSGNALSVVDCWAAWCGPCKMIAPVVEQLSEELKGKVSFGKLNVDENNETPVKYGIASIPTLLVFKKGELAERIVGFRSKDDLKKVLARHY
ncbi:MAG TPA: thioredoxin [archaeon]|nr:thioredoxin [archaeon]